MPSLQGNINGQSKEFVNKLKKLIPMERMCDKYELKSSIEFLCSDSSTYITGHNNYRRR